MKKTAEEVLKDMIALCTAYLTDLQTVRKNEPTHQFAYGEKTAYVECLEMIGRWEHAERYGLDFVVEHRFSL